MGDNSEVFIGLDVAKAKNAVAIAEAGRRGEVRYLGEIDNTPEATRHLIAKLSKRYKKLAFGPTGYGVNAGLIFHREAGAIFRHLSA